MPTGYTSGILDGKIITFEQYAKTCMRAMGACIHMRDDSFDTPYTERVPSDYHSKNVIEYQMKLIEINNMSDDQIIELETSNINSRIKQMQECIKNRKLDNALLEKFYYKALDYSPPTADHEGIKKFMIDQLRTTIDQDGNYGYYQKCLLESLDQLNNINPTKIREECILEYERQIDRHTIEYNKEVEGCNESNKWVKVFLESVREK